MSEKYAKINVEAFIQNLSTWEDAENVGKSNEDRLCSWVE